MLMLGRCSFYLLQLEFILLSIYFRNYGLKLQLFEPVKTFFEPDLLGKSPYSVRIQENTDQKKLGIWTLFTQYDWSGIIMIISEFNVFWKPVVSPYFINYPI